MFVNRRQRGNAALWLILAIVVVAAAIYYFYFRDKPGPVTEPAPPPPARIELPAQPEPEPEPPPEYEPEPFDAEAVETEPLPDLADSDAEVSEAAVGLMGAAPVQSWVVNEGILPRLVATIDLLTARELPQNIMPVRSPGGVFEATSDSASQAIDPETGLPATEYVLDPVNYRRYTPQVELLESVDTEGLVTLYGKYYPLLQESYRELGHAEGDFSDRLMEVIDHLLAAPEPEGEIRLLKPEAYYVYADPDLEALSAGEKLMVRMGPDNAARVKSKLREIRKGLQTHRE